MSLIITLSTSPAFAVSLDGNWKVVWPCADASGSEAVRCKAGDRDYFYLELWSEGDRLCGHHSATAQLGNSVDEIESGDSPSVVGLLDADSASVSFRSAWGGSGTAKIGMQGDQLHWKITAKNKGISLLPAEAVLTRQSKAIDMPHAPCLP